MSKTLLAALAQLDTANDNHWTAEGSPRLDAIKFLMGGTAVSREDVGAVAPGFSRANPVAPASNAGNDTQAPAPQPVPAPTQQPETVQASATPPAVPQAPTEASNATQAGDAGADTQTGAGAEGGEAVAETEVAAAERRYAWAVQDKAEADRELVAAAKALDVLLQAQPQPRAGEAFSDALQHYREGQQKVMAERVRRMEALKGINLRDILPTKAPIDQAFGRKSGRGRPQF